MTKNVPPTEKPISRRRLTAALLEDIRAGRAVAKLRLNKQLATGEHESEIGE